MYVVFSNTPAAFTSINISWYLVYAGPTLEPRAFFLLYAT